MNITTLSEILLTRAEASPDFRWLTLLDASGEESPLTCGELLQGGQKTAGALRQSGVGKSEPVPLIFPTSHEFLFVLWGIILAGAVPVPLYPPVRAREIDQYARQLKGIIRDCGARLVVTSDDLNPLIRSIARSADPAPSVCTARELLASNQGPTALPAVFPDDTALIQYTSGTTGVPKGVELTHRNLLSNIRVCARALNYQAGDVGVSWLPLYHDMGLIGAILSTFQYSIPLTLLSPVDFIQNPKRWLWAIHKYRGTLSAAPNFAYSLCTRKIKDHEITGLDLSSWRVAINGAELIHPETLRGFVKRFEPYGFSPKIFLSAYGLAESTLAVSFSSLDDSPPIRTYERKALELDGRAIPVKSGGASDPRAISWVSVGRPIPEHEVRIVDTNGRELPERTVGEAVARGPSVMKGYYRNPQSTESALKNGWLQTGDLGFIDKGELFITGRSKDVIIKAGRNYYPQDIEAAAGAIDGVRPGCASAFSIPNPGLGTEEIVLVAETRVRSPRRCNHLIQEIRKKVHQEVGCGLDRVHLVPPGTVAKTSSGKIQRSLCRQRYLNGDLRRSRLRVLWHWIRLYLRALWPARQ